METFAYLRTRPDGYLASLSAGDLLAILSLMPQGAAPETLMSPFVAATLAADAPGGPAVYLDRQRGAEPAIGLAEIVAVLASAPAGARVYLSFQGGAGSVRLVRPTDEGDGPARVEIEHDGFVYASEVHSDLADGPPRPPPDPAVTRPG